MRLGATTVAGALLAAAALTAAAQDSKPIQILAVTTATDDLALTKAEVPLTVDYAGKIAAGARIYVRVFRGGPAELKGKYAKALRVGKCVLFTSSARYEAYTDNDGVLRINDVVDFFRTNTGQDPQVLTLVFEQGGDGLPAEPLKLSLDGLNTYFENAVTMRMTATGKISDYWKAVLDEQARQRAQATQQASSSPGGFWSWFGLTTVSAHGRDHAAPPPKSASQDATVPAGPPSAAPVLDGAVVNGPCRKVTLLSLTAGKKTSRDAADAGTIPLRPFAELTPSTCGF
jgi:hypothetical protein